MGKIKQNELDCRDILHNSNFGARTLKKGHKEGETSHNPKRRCPVNFRVWKLVKRTPKNVALKV